VSGLLVVIGKAALAPAWIVRPNTSDRINFANFIRRLGLILGLPRRNGQQKVWILALQNALDVDRGEVADRAVETAGVVEPGDVVEDLHASLIAGEEVGAAEKLVLEGGPKGFHGGVIPTVTLAAHGGHEPSVLERCAEVP